MKPDRQIVDNLPSDLWITCGQLGIPHSEKDFWAVEKCERGGGCFIGGLSSQCGLDDISNS